MADLSALADLAPVRVRRRRTCGRCARPGHDVRTCQATPRPADPERPLAPAPVDDAPEVAPPRLLTLLLAAYPLGATLADLQRLFAADPPHVVEATVEAQVEAGWLDEVTRREGDRLVTRYRATGGHADG